MSYTRRDNDPKLIDTSLMILIIASLIAGLVMVISMVVIGNIYNATGGTSLLLNTPWML